MVSMEMVMKRRRRNRSLRNQKAARLKKLLKGRLLREAAADAAEVASVPFVAPQ
jgi:hypothetical protein